MHYLRVLSLKGIVALFTEDPFRGRRRELEAQEARSGPLPSGLAWELASLRRDVEVAREEYEYRFPLLHEHAVVAMWGLLEALVEDLVVAVLLEVPEALQREQMAVLHLTVGEAETLDRHERAWLILERLQASIKGNRMGVGQFKDLLNVFGLAPSPTAETKRTLLEMQQLRHVIVHRNAVADRKLLQTCPWLVADEALTTGQRVTITHEDYIRYWRAAHDYVIGLANMVRAQLGRDALPLYADPAAAAPFGDYLGPRFVPFE
jgi:hypothetical protein